MLALVTLALSVPSKHRNHQMASHHVPITDNTHLVGCVKDAVLVVGGRKSKFRAVSGGTEPKVFGDRVHSDLCGPFPLTVTGKYKYILCFVDVATGWSEICFLQSKVSSEVTPHFEKYVRKHKERLPNGVVREWFTDNGGEFIGHEIQEFCDEFVTKRGFTVPYCSPQNAQAERLWGILQRCMRIIIAHSGMPTNFWHYAARHANYLHNRLPRHSNETHKSPYEMLFNEKPDFSRVRINVCGVV